MEHIQCRPELRTFSSLGGGPDGGPPPILLLPLHWDKSIVSALTVILGWVCLSAVRRSGLCPLRQTRLSWKEGFFFLSFFLQPVSGIVLSFPRHYRRTSRPPWGSVSLIDEAEENEIRDAPYGHDVHHMAGAMGANWGSNLERSIKAKQQAAKIDTSNPDDEDDEITMG